MTSAERKTFLAERKKGLGASDMAIVLGLSRWKTPAALVAEKLDLLPESPMTEEQAWGLRMEPLIAAAFAARKDKEVAKPLYALTDPQCAVIRSNLDAETDEGVAVECKNVRMAKWTGRDGIEHAWGGNDTDEIPPEYLIQVQTQIACTDKDHAWVAALIGGCDLRIYRIPRSDKIITILREEGERFWSEFVAKRQVPDHDWSHPCTPELIALLCRHAPGVEIDLPCTNETYAEARKLKALRELKSMVETAEKTQKARVLSMIGDVAVVRFHDGTKLVRKQINRAAYPVKASSYEQMTISWKGEPILLNLADAVPGVEMRALPAAFDEE